MHPDTLKLAAVAVLGLGVVYLVQRSATAVVGAAGEALWSVSPTNNDNVIYQTVNKPIQWLTNDPNQTLGGAIYDVTTDGTLNPVSTNNAIYRNITPGGQSLGGWIYDIFH